MKLFLMVKGIITLVVLLLVSANAYSQSLVTNIDDRIRFTQTTDSLHQLIAVTNNDTLKIQALAALTRLYLFREREEVVDSLLMVLHDWSTRSNYSWGLAKSYQLMGFYERSIHYNPEKAIDCFEKAIYYFEKANEWELVGNCNLIIGTIYSQQGKLLTALNYALKGSEILDHRETPVSTSGWGLNSIACIYAKRKNYLLARNYHLKSLKMFESNPNRAQISYLDVRSDYTITQLKLNVDSAINYAHQTLQYIQNNKIRNNSFIINAYKALGDGFKQKKHFDSAVYWYQKAIMQGKNSGNNYDNPAIIYSDYGRVLTEQGKYNSAEELLLNFIQYRKESKSLYYWYQDDIEAYKHLAYLYEKQSRWKDAVAYHKKYEYLTDSINSVQRELISSDMEAQIELQKRDKENKILLERLDWEVTFKKITIISVLVISTLVAIVVFVITKSRMRIKEKNTILRRQFEEIQLQNKEIASQAEMLKLKSRHLEHQNTQLEELNSEKDGLMGIVAHDLRAPLNRAKGLAGLINSYLTDYESKELLAKIVKVCDDGLNLIKSILEVNSIGNQMLQSETDKLINLRVFVDSEILQEMTTVALSKEIKINNAIESQVWLTIDTTALRRVLENIISNAIKFSGPGTNVTIYTSLLDNNRVSINIQDQGPGFSYEDKQKMFKRFQRLSAQPTGGESSTGLGLAIVKSLVEKMQGSIHLDSTIGVGSEFIIELPVGEVNLRHATLSPTNIQNA